MSAIIVGYAFLAFSVAVIIWAVRKVGREQREARGFKRWYRQKRDEEDD
jgi:hypothetical protein